jgi:hypothetical protein
MCESFARFGCLSSYFVVFLCCSLGYLSRCEFSLLRIGVVLHHYVQILNFSSNPRRIHSGQKDKEKEEHEWLYVVISDEQPFPFPHPPPSTLHGISPACGCVYQD